MSKPSRAMRLEIRKASLRPDLPEAVSVLSLAATPRLAVVALGPCRAIWSARAKTWRAPREHHREDYHI